MMRTVWLGSAAALLFGSVLLAEPGIVRTRDGSAFEGDVVDGTETVQVTIRGVETVIPKMDVVSIERVGSVDEELKARVARLDAQDVAGRVAVARDAFAKRRYDLSRDYLLAALRIDPNSQDAGDMLEVVDSHIRMERSKLEQAVTPPPAPAPQVQPTTAPTFTDRRLLTPADIEAIRRKEVKPGETSVRLRFEGDVKKRFADSQSIAFPDFNLLTPLDQAMRILSAGDESMKSKVRIVSDPASIQVYRRQIQPLVVQGCATTGCHGAAPGGGFMLFTAPENDLTTYTNFYILQSYSRESGDQGGVFTRPMAYRLIARGQGDRSLIANYGLPPQLSDMDHPPVRGRPIQPIFRNKEDLRYQVLVDWMNLWLHPFEPDYGILYTPPLPTTMPAR